MNVTEAVQTRLEIREYSDEPVESDTKMAILNAGRLAPSGRNLQHWRFILVDDEDDLNELAALSPTGSWIRDTDFAIVVCTDRSYDFNALDAGRAVTYMQFVAWEHGVGSRIYTVDQPAVDEFLRIPNGYELTLVAGFGYPREATVGLKDRKSVETIAYHGTFGSPLTL